MSDRLNIRSYHVVVDAPADIVFDFVNDLENLPRWSIHWCKGIRLLDEGAMVTTAQGEVFFTVTGDRDTGVLDWWSGPAKESAQRWPTRVTALPDGRALYQLTALLDDAVPPGVDQWFADELGMIKRLVEEQAVVAWDRSDAA